MSYINVKRAKPYGPGGCQVPVGNQICGETKTLSILHEFKDLYEKKLHDLESETEAGGDCLQAKLNLQGQWIKDLMEQNEMMARAVEQLEIEATDRVKLLEEKLASSAKCICEVMNRYRDFNNCLNLDEPFQKMFYVENDVKNLLEFIRRAREDNRWSIDGLQFYDVTYKDLFGDCKPCSNKECQPQPCVRETCNTESEYCTRETCPKAICSDTSEASDTCSKQEDILSQKGQRISELEKRNEHIFRYGDPEKLTCMLRQKENEFAELRRSMLDMRKALAEEVAAKHDTICALRKDIQQLEEQCLQADKQIAFKDDIIKELRKEIKQLKQQAYQEAVSTISTLEMECTQSKNDFSQLQHQVNSVKSDLKTSLERSKVLLHESLGDLEISNSLQELISKLSSIKESSIEDSSDSNTQSKRLEDIMNISEKSKAPLGFVNQLCTTREVLDRDSILINLMEKEIVKLKKDIAIRDQQLVDQLKIIDVLVTKLYEINKELQLLETKSKKFNSLSLEETNLNMKSALDHSFMENKSLKSKVDDVRIEIIELEKQLKSFTTEKEELKRKLRDARATADNASINFSQEISKNEVTCKKNVKEMNRLKDEIQRLEQELEMTKKDKKTLQSQMNDLEHEISRLKSDKKRLTSENDDLEEQVRSVKRKLKQEESKVQGLENQITSQLSKIAQLEGSVNKLKEKPQDHKGEQTLGVICLCKILPNKCLKISKKCQLHNPVRSSSTTIPPITSTSTPAPRRQSIRIQSPTPSRTISPIAFPKASMSSTMSSTKVKIINDPEYHHFKSNLESKGVNEDEYDDDEGDDDDYDGNNGRPNNMDMAFIENDEYDDDDYDDEDNGNNGDLSKTELRNRSVQSDTEKREMSVETRELGDQVCVLEAKLIDCHGRADNLQKAVDFYVNSINVLEAAEQRAKLEIEQQKITMANLQEALVLAKHELDEFRQTNKQEIQQHQYLVEVLYVNMLDLEEHKRNLYEQVSDMYDAYKSLLNINFNLEVDYIESLQDISVMEMRLSKYHTIIKYFEEASEELKKELKKVKAQKKSYEEVIHYFQYEVRVMSDQLVNLQEILNVSNESSQVETAQLTEALQNLKETNDELCSKLCGAEQRFLLENQMNQINESRINELCEAVCQKDMELNHYQCALQDMKDNLETSLKEKQALEDNICHLNCRVVQLEDMVRVYEHDHAQHEQNNQTCQTQIEICERNLMELRQLLEKKNADLDELNAEYNAQYNILIATQNELLEFRQAHDDRTSMIVDLKDTLCECTNKNDKLNLDVDGLKQQLMDLARAEALKEREVKQYRKIISELRHSLVNLNQNLQKATDQDTTCKCDHGKVRFKDFKSETSSSCDCESTSYAQITEDLNHLVTGLKKQLTEKDVELGVLKDQDKKNKAKISELHKGQFKKEKDYQDMVQKLARAHNDEVKLKDEIKKLEKSIADMKADIRKKDEQINSFRDDLKQIKCGKQQQDDFAQEEFNVMKNELNVLKQKHLKLKEENEALQCQLTRAQKKVSELQEKHILMKEQLEQYLLEIEGLQNEKDMLCEKNEQLNNDIQTLQNSLACMKRQNRYNTDLIKTLEQELIEIKSNRDDISGESQHVVDNVRLWLQEQKTINEQVSKRLKNYSENIEKLKFEKAMLSQQLQVQQQPSPTYAPEPTCSKRNFPKNLPSKSRTPQRCPGKMTRYQTNIEASERSPSPWSLGSQGNVSAADPRDSRNCSPSDAMYAMNDWYSPNFKDAEESEYEDDENNWVAAVENLTAQFKRASKTWKSKMQNAECCVSKDDK